MKAWILTVLLVAVIGFSSFADARGRRSSGIKGTITAVNGTSFTMTTTAGKKNPGATVKTYTVNASSATISGGTPAVGAKVSVIGSQSVTQINGQTLETITATTVKVSGKHKKKST